MQVLGAMLRLLGRRKSEEERRDELLSAYLDGELGEKGREQLEARLSQEPALRAELRALQQTVSMVHELRQVSAPRNFILSESMVRRREPTPAPERRRAWAAPVLTAATTIVSLLFFVVLVGDLLLSGVGGFASAPEPTRQPEEAAPMALEVTGTHEVEGEVETAPTASSTASQRIPRMESDMATEELEEGPRVTAETMAAEAAAGAEAPPEAETTAPSVASAEAPREEPEIEAEEELSAAEATRATEAPSGAGATPPPAGGGGPTKEVRSLAVPTVAPTISNKSVLTPTIPPAEPVITEGELGRVEPTVSELEATPPPVREQESAVSQRLPWRTLEITLGLAALMLTFTTVLAWRARRG